jgi:hypothetical protein
VGIETAHGRFMAACAANSRGIVRGCGGVEDWIRCKARRS